MSNSQSIVLAGFMGTGKSTVGAILAKQLNRVFVDMDSLIEQRTTLTIPSIFEKYGEAHFRAIERGIAHELAMFSNLIIATGGGALLDTASQDTFLNHTFVVCLRAAPDIIEQRLQTADNRPLASQWKVLWGERQPIYDSLPNQIDTSGKIPTNIAQEILDIWQSKSK